MQQCSTLCTTQVLRRSEAVCLEMGFESALQYLAQHLLVLGVPAIMTSDKPLSVTRKLKRKRIDGYEEVSGGGTSCHE